MQVKPLDNYTLMDWIDDIASEELAQLPAEVHCIHNVAVMDEQNYLAACYAAIKDVSLDITQGDSNE